MFISAFLQNYRLEEYIQFMDDVRQLCVNNDVAALQLGKRFEDFSTQFTLLEAAYAKPKRHELTVVIEELDAQRDRLFSQINFYLNANSLETDNEISVPASQLHQKITDYGGVAEINKLNYQAQTAALRNLIDDLLKMPQVDQLSTVVNYRLKLEALQSINEEFRITFVERTQDRGTLSNEEASALLRAPMNEAYYKLLFRIQASAELNQEQETPLPNFKLVADGVNDAIKRLNSLVESRKTPSAGTGDSSNTTSA